MTINFGDPISTCTTTQALEDGVLVDAGVLVSDLFTWPVLLTSAAWADCVAWSDVDAAHTGAIGQSESGRLWDVLWMAYVAIRKEPVAAGGAPLTFQLYRISREATATSDGEVESDLVTLKAAISAHDDGSPVLLISEPEED